MSKKASGLRFTLSVGKLPADAFVVVGFTLHEQFSSPFALELEVASAKPSVEFRSLLDSNATLTIWRETEVQRVLNGIVTSIEQGDAGLHQTRYRFSIRPSLWRAGLGHRSRIFQQQNFLEILETLLKESKISDYAHALRYPHAVREFCVQYNESDLDFIHRLAAEEGIYYFFEHQNGKHTLVFSDDCAALHDGPTLPYYPDQSSTSLDEPCVTTFKRRESLGLSEVLLKDYTFKDPLWLAEFGDVPAILSISPVSTFITISQGALKALRWVNLLPAGASRRCVTMPIRVKGQATARRCNPAFALPWKTILWRLSIPVGKSPKPTIQGSNPKRLRVTRAGQELS